MLVCSGIGIVNAIEVVHAFPEEDGLQKFKEWIESPDPSIFGKLHLETSGRSKKRKLGGNDSDGKGKGLEHECIQGSDDKQYSNEAEQVKEIFMSKHVSMFSCRELRMDLCHCLILAYTCSCCVFSYYSLIYQRNVSKNWHIPATFPSESVVNAYISPQVDASMEPFSWGRPDLGLLRK